MHCFSSRVTSWLTWTLRVGGFVLRRRIGASVIRPSHLGWPTQQQRRSQEAVAVLWSQTIPWDRHRQIERKFCTIVHPTLRRSCCTRDDATILHLDRSPQPALNVEKHPRAVRMMTNRLEQQLSIDAVEVALDVDIEPPCKPPAALTGLLEGIDRRSAGAVPIGVRVEAGPQDRLQVLFDDFLGNSVANRWNAQRPGPSIALGKVNPPHRWRKVAP